MQLCLPNPTVATRIATAADQTYIDDLAKKFSNEVGFIPRVALEKYIELGGIELALENEQPAGYILSRGYLRWCIAMRPITQAAVQFDAQRRHVGLELVSRAETHAREVGQIAIQACCREGLDANDFWKAAGFREICRLDPRASRNKQIIVWRKPLANHIPPWFILPPPVHGYRARKSVTA